MPKTPIDYSKSIIYKICCKDPEIKDIYIGSTTNFTKRKNQHKREVKSENRHQSKYKIYQFIKNNGYWENWDMVMIEEYKDCESKLQLEKREREYYDLLKPTLNSQLPIKTIEDEKKYQSEFYKKHIERIKERKKKKYTCCCGCVIVKSYKKRHEQSPKHKRLMGVL